MVAVKGIGCVWPLHKVAHPPVKPFLVLSNCIVGDMSILVLPSSRSPSCGATKREVSAPGYRSTAVTFPISVVLAFSVQAPHVCPRRSQEGEMLVPSTLVDVPQQGVLLATGLFRIEVWYRISELIDDAAASYL